MDYQTAKAAFEGRITKMQQDLHEYANRSAHSDKVIAFRAEQINELIDYYQQAERTISEQEMTNQELHYKYNKLKDDTQKLVTFCELHQINPNMIFFYTNEQLQELSAKGAIIYSPLRHIYAGEPDESLTQQYITIAEQSRLRRQSA